MSITGPYYFSRLFSRIHGNVAECLPKGQERLTAAKALQQ